MAEAGNVYLHDTYTLKGTCKCVIKLLRDALCMCACVCVRESYSACCSASWLHKIPGRCNLKVSTHACTHIQTDRVGSIFIISLPAKLSPESQKGPSQVRWFFFWPPQKAETIQYREEQTAREATESAEGACSLSHIRVKHMQIHTDTEQGSTRRV